MFGFGKKTQKTIKQDRKRLSNEDHETAYVKETAKKLLADLKRDKIKDSDACILLSSKVKRLCRYALKH